MSQSLLFLVCDKNGKCVDYCNYKEKNLLPGESYNNKCNLITCNENFSMNFQGLVAIKLSVILNVQFGIFLNIAVVSRARTTAKDLDLTSR